MNTIKKGFTLVELLVVIAILGMLMAALFPAISGAMLRAQGTTMQKSGADLVNQINQRSIERNNNGKGTLWPIVNGQTEETEGDDIATKTFGDADKYFEELFDIKNYGTTQHYPYVDKELLKCLSGAGVPGYKGNKSLAGSVAWKIATDCDDAGNVPEELPALVTRNVDTASFPVSGTTETRGSTRVLSPDSQFPNPFGNKAIVVVNKSGGARVLTGRDQTLSDIYRQQPAVFAEGVQISYLKPTGK